MYQLVYPTLLQSIAFRLWQIYLIILRLSDNVDKLSSSPPGSAAHLWWAMMIGWVIWVMKVKQNVKKASLSHKKMKTSFLYYIQLLMIGQVIQATKDDQNAKKRPPKSSKNEMLIFGLCSNSDDQPSNPSNESQPKCDKRPHKPSKNEILIFILHSTSDEWSSNQMPPQQNINCSAPNLQNRAHFSDLVEMSPRSGMLWLKLTKM